MAGMENSNVGNYKKTEGSTPIKLELFSVHQVIGNVGTQRKLYTVHSLISSSVLTLYAAQS